MRQRSTGLCSVAGNFRDLLGTTVSVSCDLAGSDIRPEAVELGDNVDLDYFDRQDLGRLRRKIRNAVQGYRRERELYLEIVTQYFRVRTWPSEGRGFAQGQRD